VGSQIIQRKAGESCGKLMCQWRQLRQREPGLFSQILVWQQPSAFVDAVLFSWMQRLESQEHQQLIRLVDAFSGGWSSTGEEVSFLCQQLQASVAPGCTAVSQITDTGLAAPAKEAACQEKEKLRELLRLKARQQGVPARYKTGLREMLGVAYSMHRKMVEENQANQTVLREFRQCGWAAWRPQAGRLVQSSLQEWAKPFPESSAKIRACCRAERLSWLDEAGKPQLGQHWSSARLQPSNGCEQPELPKALQPAEMEVSYDRPGEAVELELDQSWLNEAEDRTVQALMLHPSERSAEQQYLAELALLPSQAPPAQAKEAPGPKPDRPERVKAWRASLGKKKLADRLMQIVPLASQGIKAKAGGKQKKKKNKKKTFKASHSNYLY